MGDRISELPKDIIHCILSFLPIKDVVRTRALSSIWKDSLCSSYEYQIDLHYDHNSYALEKLLKTEGGQQEPTIKEIRDKFMDDASNGLLQLIQQQTPVLELAFDVAVIGSEFDCVNQFMEVLQGAKVEELRMFVQTQDFSCFRGFLEADICYEFPYSFLLASRWLRSLSVEVCKFRVDLSISEEKLIKVDTFSSLRQLWLWNVMLPRQTTLNNIARCCPGLDLILFGRCSIWFITLNLSSIPKLKTASVVDFQDGTLQCVDVRETNLEEFRCSRVGLECLISLLACHNIKKLVLYRCSVNTPDLLKDLTYFPLLEEASLQQLTINGFDRIKAASSHMRHFMYTGTGFAELYFDCPNLETFYCVTRVPTLSKSISLYLAIDIQYIYFSFDVIYELSTLWFICLREFLKQIQGCYHVNLHLMV